MIPLSSLPVLNIKQVRNDSPKEATAQVLVGYGDDFESANCAVMYHARGLVDAAEMLSGEQQREFEALKEGDTSAKFWAENWYDGLTYCEILQYFMCSFN